MSYDGALGEFIRLLGPAKRQQVRRYAIVTHPLNMPALESAMRSTCGQPPNPRDHDAFLLRSLGIGAIPIITNECLDRWVHEWRPPDWGPLWHLGPEDEAALRPLGFGTYGEVVGKPAFWKIDQQFVFGVGSIVDDPLMRERAMTWGRPLRAGSYGH